MNVYDMPNEVVYKNTSYTILNFLDNGLLLVVETSEFEKGAFPLTPVVIPNEIVR